MGILPGPGAARAAGGFRRAGRGEAGCSGGLPPAPAMAGACQAALQPCVPVALFYFYYSFLLLFLQRSLS